MKLTREMPWQAERWSRCRTLGRDERLRPATRALSQPASNEGRHRLCRSSDSKNLANHGETVRSASSDFVLSTDNCSLVLSWLRIVVAFGIHCAEGTGGDMIFSDQLLALRMLWGQNKENSRRMGCTHGTPNCSKHACFALNDLAGISQLNYQSAEPLPLRCTGTFLF